MFDRLDPANTWIVREVGGDERIAGGAEKSMLGNNANGKSQAGIAQTAIALAAQ